MIRVKMLAGVCEYNRSRCGCSLLHAIQSIRLPWTSCFLGREGKPLRLKYGYGLAFFKQQPDNKAKAQRASGNMATVSTSLSLRPRLSERLEAWLRPRPQAAAGQQGHGPASVWKYGYGLDIKQQLDEKAKAQRASGTFFKQEPNNDKARRASGSPTSPRLLAAALRRQGKRPP